MIWQQTPYTVPLMAASAISIIFGLHILVRYPRAGSKIGALAIFANAEWILGYALELTSASPSAMIFWDKMQFIAVLVLPAVWIVYAICYTGYERWLHRYTLGILIIVPGITSLLALTNDAHGLIWSSYTLITDGPFLTVNETYGAWFWIYVVYASMLLLSGIILFTQVFIRSRRPYRLQTGAVLLGLAVPLLTVGAVLSGLNPFPHLNPIPFALVVTNAAVALSIIYFGLGDIMPLARETVIESIRDSVVILDTENRIVDLNLSAQSLLGDAVTEVVGKPIEEVWPQWSSRVEPLTSGRGLDKEIVLDPGHHIYDVDISPLSDWYGRDIGRVIVLRDITDRKRVETAEKYRLLAENVQDVIWTADTNLRFTYMSPSVKHLRGYTAEEVLAQSLDEILTSSSLEVALKTFEKEMAESLEQGTLERSVTLELEHICKDGSTVWAEVKMTGLHDADGRLIGILGVSRDITERKQAEEALHGSEEKFRTIFERANDGIALMDKNGTILDLNKRAQDMLGYSRDSIVGKDFRDIGVLSPEGCEKALELFRRVLKTKNPAPLTLIELELKHKEGNKILVEVSIGLIKKRGKIEGILTILRDVTQRKQAEERIKQSLEEKEILLREIHHRVKNNIQIISSLLSLQSHYIEDEKYVEMLQESQNRIKSMALVHEKLYQSEDLANIDFNDYIETLIRTLFRVYGADPRRIGLTLDIEDVSLDIDAAIPCGLIINELVSNALRHAFPDNREGEIAVTVRSTDNTIELTVADNGVGMPDTVDLKTTQSLGLHLVAILAENQLDGEIWLDRRKGTALHIKFKR